MTGHPVTEVSCEKFLYYFKAGPAGGLRPPSGPATTPRPPGDRPHRQATQDDRFPAFTALHSPAGITFLLALLLKRQALELPRVLGMPTSLGGPLRVT